MREDKTDKADKKHRRRSSLFVKPATNLLSHI